MSTSRFCYRYSSVQSKMNNAPKRPMETTSMHVNLTNRQCIRVDMAIQVGKGGSAIWFENISPLANKWNDFLPFQSQSLFVPCFGPSWLQTNWTASSWKSSTSSTRPRFVNDSFSSRKFYSTTIRCILSTSLVHVWDSLCGKYILHKFEVLTQYLKRKGHIFVKLEEWQ